MFTVLPSVLPFVAALVNFSNKESWSGVGGGDGGGVVVVVVVMVVGERKTGFKALL